MRDGNDDALNQFLMKAEMIILMNCEHSSSRQQQSYTLHGFEPIVLELPVG